MLGAVGRCCTGALQALRPGVQPLKALLGSPAVLSRKVFLLNSLARGKKRHLRHCQKRAPGMLTLAAASYTLTVLPALQQGLNVSMSKMKLI